MCIYDLGEGQVVTESDTVSDTKVPDEIKAFILVKCQRCDSKS